MPSSLQSIVVVGSLNTDLVFQTPRLPAPGETLRAGAMHTATGGKGANQAAAIARLGGSVRMVGNVGQDAMGDNLLQDLRSAGVDVSLVGRVAAASGTAAIFVSPDAQNSILIAAGANDALRPRDLHAMQESIASAAMVLTQMETPADTLDELARMCEACGTPLMLDPAPAREIAAETLKRVAWLTPNESEARMLFGIDAGMADVEALNRFADAILARGPRNLALKLGSRGVFLATEDGIRELLAAPRVRAVDTTAAGDCFNGAFALRLQAGDSSRDAARFANAAAAVAVTRPGALPSLPTLEEVNALHDEAADRA